jgi:RNA polymerase sigma-70 factor (ECF subfamily)
LADAHLETLPLRAGISQRVVGREANVSTDDASLVRSCLGGDAGAIRLLIDRFQVEVFGLCVRLLHHRHDAEDVTQEVFLRVFRSLGRWDPARPLRPWIMTITVNRCRTWLSQRRRRPEPVDYLHETLSARSADDAGELRAEIAAAVADLRFEYRTAFVLFHEEGQPYDEIAQVLDRPVGTIKTWLHRARLEILERLRRRGLVPDEPAPDLETRPLQAEPCGRSALLRRPCIPRGEHGASAP